MQSIDHIVLPVTTLALARARLAALGFTVATDARHPFGTGNCCVFFRNGAYAEPLTVVDRAAADRAAAEGNVFVRRLKRFTERHGEGLAMVALASDDALRANAAFAAAGFDEAETFAFRRRATRADGGEREIGVTLAFAESQAMPDALLFACQHIDRSILFDPALLEHPNGASGIVSVVAVADDPAAFAKPVADALAAASGVPPGNDQAAAIEILTPAAFRERYGVASPDPRRGLRFAAVEIAAAGLDKAAEFAGPGAERAGDRLVVPPAPGLGAVLAFTGESSRG